MRMRRVQRVMSIRTSRSTDCSVVDQARRGVVSMIPVDVAAKTPYTSRSTTGDRASARSKTECIAAAPQ